MYIEVSFGMRYKSKDKVYLCFLCTLYILSTDSLKIFLFYFLFVCCFLRHGFLYVVLAVLELDL